MPKAKEGVEWDLSGLYSGINDLNIEKDKKGVLNLTEKFVKEYKGKIRSKRLTSKMLLKALQDLEKIWNLSYKYIAFVSYIYDKNKSSEKIGKLYQKSKEFYTKIDSKLVWFNIEWLDQSNAKAKKLINSKDLCNYKHFLKTSRVFKPFTLSEKEEELLVKTSPAGAGSFVRFYDMITTKSKYKLRVGGKTKELSQSELVPYLSTHKDRNVRRSACKSFGDGLGKDADTYTYVLNTLLLSAKIKDEVRGYKYPQHSTFLSYELDKTTVDGMVACVEARYKICERFYRAKKKVLGYKGLHEWDRYSSIYSTDKKYSWDDAKKIVLESFYEFSPRFAGIARKFFDNNWIDSKIKDGKISGAYCSYSTPNRNPYILMNFNGKISDVLTLAHELGHGVHAYLSRNNALFEYWPSTAVAEIASVFAESLVFEKLFSEVSNKKAKIDLVAAKIQDMFATVFRQTAFYLFETDIHRHRRSEGELSTKEFGDYYQKRLKKMFGSGLKLTDVHKKWWMPVSHFYHYDFYVFTYAFGELLATSLFSKYKKDGKTFVNNYLKALSMGGSLDPYSIAKIMGVNIDKKDFWQLGLGIIDGYVKEFEELCESI